MGSTPEALNWWAVLPFAAIVAAISSVITTFIQNALNSSRMKRDRDLAKFKELRFLYSESLTHLSRRFAAGHVVANDPDDEVFLATAQHFITELELSGADVTAEQYHAVVGRFRDTLDEWLLPDVKTLATHFQNLLHRMMTELDTIEESLGSTPFRKAHAILKDTSIKRSST